MPAEPTTDETEPNGAAPASGDRPTGTTEHFLADPSVAAALREARAADAEVERAKLSARRAKDELGFALFVAARPYRESSAPQPQQLLHHLYWEATDIRPGDIARAFGLPTSKLALAAGPRALDVACSSCAEATTTHRTSRSDSRHVWCRACHDRIEAERQRLDDRRRARDELARSPYDDQTPLIDAWPYLEDRTAFPW